MILKDKFYVNVVDFCGTEIAKVECFDFYKAMDAYNLKVKEWNKDDKSYVYKALDLPHLCHTENNGWFYEVGRDELETLRVNLWGYTIDNQRCRVATREVHCRENSSRGEYVNGKLQTKDPDKLGGK